MIEESAKLLSRRCLDTGFVPYLSIGSLTSSFGTIKLFGAPLLSSRILKKEKVEDKLVELGLGTRLGDLELEDGSI